MTESKHGKGSTLRLVVLLGILAVAAFGYYYDRFVLPEKNEAMIEAALKLMDAPDEEGDGITRAEVVEKIGFAPQSESTQDKYVIEKYEFKRVLPFLQGEYLSVIYENGSLVQMLRNKAFDSANMDNSMGIRSPDPATYKGKNPEIGVAGGGGEGDAAKKSDDDEEKDSEKSGEDKEASSDEDKSAEKEGSGEGDGN